MISPSGKKPVFKRIIIPVTLLLCLAFLATGASASTRGAPTTTTSPFGGLQELTTAPTPVPTEACMAPYSCMERSVAVAQWGEGGFLQSSDTPCEHARSASGIAVEKYCYQQKVSYINVPVVTTTTQIQAMMRDVPVVTTTTPSKLVMPSSATSDRDNDGKSDFVDNCPDSYNPAQIDWDGDSVGTGCDNCEGDANIEQYDTDFDCLAYKKAYGFWIYDANVKSSYWINDPMCGDECDRCPGYDDTQDADKDRVPDACDKCPGINDNNIGSCNDCLDPDKDGIASCVDNCKIYYNPLQENADSDTFGNVCDYCWEEPSFQNDADGDCGHMKGEHSYWKTPYGGWLKDPHCGDECDFCRYVSSTDQADNDGDKVGNPCDNCWEVPDYTQGDFGACAEKMKDLSYWNGQKWSRDPQCGAVCHDNDGDGIVDQSDNCRDQYNPDQRDTNNDNQGDACSCYWCKDYVIPLWLNGWPDEKIDIIFVGTTHYGNDRARLYQDAKNYIDNGFAVTPPLHQNIHKFNFYFMDISSEAAVSTFPDCGFGAPWGDSGGFKDATVFANSVVVMTQEPGFRDWSGTKFNRPVVAVRNNTPPVLIHEIGHSVFGLGDEYCCDSHYAYSPNIYPRVPDSMTAVFGWSEDRFCLDARKAYGFYGTCQLFCPKDKEKCGPGFYTIDPITSCGTNTCCFMEGPSKYPAFVQGSACRQWIEASLNKLP